MQGPALLLVYALVRQMNQYKGKNFNSNPGTNLIEARSVNSGPIPKKLA